MTNHYDLYKNDCPFCDQQDLIRWGYYKRKSLPSTKLIKVQRLRCKSTGRTTNVLPSFLLARKSCSVEALKYLILTFIDNPGNWKQLLDPSIDLSKAYRWLRILVNQATAALPDIRKDLLKLSPEHQLMDPKPEPIPSARIILKRFLALSSQLFKAAVRLVEQNEPSEEDLFCFINYFLAKKTGKPLLVL